MNSSLLVRIFQNWQYWAGQSWLQLILTCKKGVSKRCTTVNSKFSLQRLHFYFFSLSLLTWSQALLKKFTVSFSSQPVMEAENTSQDHNTPLVFFSRPLISQYSSTTSKLKRHFSNPWCQVRLQSSTYMTWEEASFFLGSVSAEQYLPREGNLIFLCPIFLLSSIVVTAQSS